MEKICRICGTPKFIDEFHKKKGSPDGHRNECKECVKDIQKKYKEKSGFKEKQKEYDKKRYEENRDKILERKKEYHKENREKILEQKEKYRNDPKNKERIKDYLDNYREEHREELREYIRNNPDKNSKGQARYRENNPHVIAWRSILYSTLKRLNTEKQSHTIDELGYSAIQLKEHLESQFKPGMSWNNHGDWHIDHVRPVTSFDKDTDVSIVCALNNLQPLWAEENLSKSNNY
jgi:DNA repair exonuclease SbcCD ATPase subunit